MYPPQVPGQLLGRVLTDMSTTSTWTRGPPPFQSPRAPHGQPLSLLLPVLIVMFLPESRIMASLQHSAL